LSAKEIDEKEIDENFFKNVVEMYATLEQFIKTF